MSLVVNTNIGSLNAQRSLASSGEELQTAMERLSSGKKINSAADDAAGFAIAERMTAQVRGLNMATKNVNDGLSMLAVIENATNDVTDMLQRMRELAVQAANDTNSSTDRQYLQSEVAALIEEIDRVASQTRYNGERVLDGSLQNASLQVGTDQGQNVSFSVSNISTSSIGALNTLEAINYHAPYDSVTNTTNLSDYYGDDRGFGSVSVGDYVSFSLDPSKSYKILDIVSSNGGPPDEIKVQGDPAGDGALVSSNTIFKNVALKYIDVSSNADLAVASISTALEQLSSQRAAYGALQNRLEYTASNLMNVSEFTTAARSRIEDADFAADSAKLAKAQVLQQTGTAMLAQANSSSQLVLSLIR
jgi:flagellin